MTVRIPPPHTRRNQWFGVCAAVSTAVVLAACSGPEAGAITDDATTALTEPSNAPTPFALGLPEGGCPTSEVIPTDLAASGDPGYVDASGPGHSGSLTFLRCDYLFDGDIAALDGTQAVLRVQVDFYTSDGGAYSVRSPENYTQTDLEQVTAARYFRDWDQATHRSDHEVNPIGKGLESSDYVAFESFSSIDNLYVNANISFVVTDEDHDSEPDLDTDSAAYEILEAVVAPVVAELDTR